MIDVTQPICVRDSDVDISAYSAKIRRGYEDTKHLRLFDRAHGIGTDIYSFRPGPDFYSPRHSHTSTQVRYILSGTMNYGRETYSAGDCTIIPDSVKYGPLQPGPGDLPHFVQVVFGGASGVPMLDPDEVSRAQETLAERGRFEGGIYHPNSGQPRDAYEAVAEEVLGERVVYPPARVQNYVVVHTPLLPWVNAKNGVSVKHVAYLFETGPNVKLVRMAAGAVLPAGQASCQQVRIVTEGSVSWDDEDFAALSFMHYPYGSSYPETRSRQDGTTLLVVQWTEPGREVPPFLSL